MCKTVFGLKRYDSVTKVLIETGMPSFDTVLHNSHLIFSRCWNICSIHNKTVGHLDAFNRRWWIMMFITFRSTSVLFLVRFYLFSIFLYVLRAFCVFCVFVCIMCFVGQVAWNKNWWYLILIIGRVLTDHLTVWPVLLSTVCSQHPVSTHPSPHAAGHSAPLGRRVNGDGVLIQRSTPLQR